MNLKLTKEQWKYITYTLIILGILFFGFFLGRKTIKGPKPQVKIEYIKGETIHDSIPYPVPYKVIIPADTADIIRECVKNGIYTELFPNKIIKEYVEVEKSDTTTIMKDWATERFYGETLFDIDTLGTCSFKAKVQYNRMRVLSYEYTPYIKKITKTEYNVKFFSPYIGIGTMVNPWDIEKNPMGIVNAGFFIKEKFGIQAQYQRSFVTKNDYVGGSVLWKF